MSTSTMTSAGIKEGMSMKKALLLYCSVTGNTQKVAGAIEAGLAEGGMETSLVNFKDADKLDYFDYDLVCVGSPSYNWSVPLPFNDFLKKKFAYYKSIGKIVPNSPRVGKKALVFCTYSGPHTGIDEAIPTGLYMGQFFDHMGFDILDKWYVLCEFIGSEEMSTLGRMGDIRGLPTEKDLADLKEKAKKLALAHFC
ncbi:MAG: flavodoxin domain-containing protein [Oscillospiraceae bacterium]|nr:flavodoxin domain-containing protein [Oscillospiraceae bacterium]